MTFNIRVMPEEEYQQKKLIRDAIKCSENQRAYDQYIKKLNYNANTNITMFSFYWWLGFIAIVPPLIAVVLMFASILL
jgi:hypothetical protein